MARPFSFLSSRDLEICNEWLMPKKNALKPPKKPVKPVKPQEPQKTYKIQEVAVDLKYSGDTVQSIVDTIRAIEPKRPLSDFYVFADYERGYYDGVDIITEIRYEKEVPNKQYKKQLHSYNKKLKIYSAKLENWKEDTKKYRKDKKKYDEEMELLRISELKKELKTLEKRKKQLEKEVSQ